MWSEAGAAWVQAIASIAGIALAFFFPWRALQADREAFKAEQEQRRLDREERAREREEERQLVERERAFRRRKFARPTIHEIDSDLAGISRKIKELEGNASQLATTGEIKITHLLNPYFSTFAIHMPVYLVGPPDEAFRFSEYTWEKFFDIAAEIREHNAFVAERKVLGDGRSALRPEVSDMQSVAVRLKSIFGELVDLRSRLVSESGLIG